MAALEPGRGRRRARRRWASTWKWMSACGGWACRPWRMRWPLPGGPRAAALTYRGIAFYPAIFASRCRNRAPRSPVRDDVQALVAALGEAGVPTGVVSGSSTPAAWRMHEVTGVTEVRPGTYVYNDRATAELGACADDCAFTVLATVVNTAVPGQAVIDAGSKGREPLPAGDPAGTAVCWTGLTSGSRGCRGARHLGPWRDGTATRARRRGAVIPNHVCVVVHLNDVIHGVRGELVETTARQRPRAGAVREGAG